MAHFKTVAHLNLQQPNVGASTSVTLVWISLRLEAFTETADRWNGLHPEWWDLLYRGFRRKLQYFQFQYAPGLCARWWETGLRREARIPEGCFKRGTTPSNPDAYQSVSLLIWNPRRTWIIVHSRAKGRLESLKWKTSQINCSQSEFV